MLTLRSLHVWRYRVVDPGHAVTDFYLQFGLEPAASGYPIAMPLHWAVDATTKAAQFPASMISTSPSGTIAKISES
jgi:hypothetical protein